MTRWFVRHAAAVLPLAWILVGVAVLPPRVGGDEPAAVEQRLRATVSFLASEQCEGRASGTAGGERAAQHIADQFRQIGLKMDLFENGPFQKFSLPGASEVDPKTQLRLVAPSGSNGQKPEVVELRLGSDFMVLGTASAGTLDAPLVFAGYGITAPPLKYDDYAGLDVKGKVVVMLRHEPQQDNPQSVFDGTKESTYATPQRKLANAAEHGAAAVILCTDEVEIRKAVEPARKQWQQALDELAAAHAKARSTERSTLAEIQTHRTGLQELLQKAAAASDALARQCDPLLPRTPGGERAALPIIHCRRAALDRILRSAAGTDLATLERQIDAGPKPQSRDLAGWRVTGCIEVKSATSEVNNVVAVLPGAGPLAEETIVVGAHYDHLGTRTDAAGKKEIRPGADDNASGVAGVLEIARQLAARKDRQGRRVVFIAFGAEERGLVGSRHYVEHPLVPLDKTVAMLNLDMIGRMREDQLTAYGTGTSAGFAELLDRLSQKHGLKLNKQAPGTGPSDHASFNRSQIPVLFFNTGFHSDLHRPTDVVEKLNIAGMRRVSELIVDLVNTLATDEKRPQYVVVPDARAKRPLSGLFLGVAGNPAPGGGYAIRSVLPNLPAQKAGLREGDVIVRFGDSEIKEPDDLMRAILKQKPGDRVRLKVRRGTEQLDIDVTLGGSP
jgi:hypothetical protein